MSNNIIMVILLSRIVNCTYFCRTILSTIIVCRRIGGSTILHHYIYSISIALSQALPEARAIFIGYEKRRKHLSMITKYSKIEVLNF